MFSGNSLTRFLAAVGVFAALSVSVSGCGNEEDNRPATWSYIYPGILEPSCATASCHSDFSRRGGVNFGYADEAWFQLVCRHFAIPSNSAQSAVINLMNASGSNRMPPDFALPATDIAKISEWIMNGAQDDIDNQTPANTCGQ
jgi:hypothetical protein